MKWRALGRTGIRVPELCLGTMTFGFQSDEATSFAILDRAYEAGVTFLDAADVYPLGGDMTTVGRTEEILGRWMKARGTRQRLLLATKCFGRMSDDKNSGGLSRYAILRAVEASLRRLGTDVIDLYQSHAFDPHTPVEETLRAFDDLVRAGKVRYLGCSNYPAWRLSQALAASEREHLARYETSQSRYNLLYREIETELVPLCQSEGLGLLVYNPIAGGVLSGKYRAGDAPQEGTRFTLGRAGGMYQQRYWQDATMEAAQQYSDACRERGLDPATVAVAWVLRQPAVASAILGASRPEQLDATLAGAELELDDGLAATCDALVWQLPRRPVIEGYR
jgi:aryl-alcohol dehydrogenase-like predicted oxidoreductase